MLSPKKIVDFFPPKISSYLARVYVVNFFAAFTVVMSFVYLFDTVELMRRAAKFDDIALGLVLKMGVFKLPEVGFVVLPFIILSSAIFTLWQLNRHHELEIMRSSGLSVWQFLAPVAASAALIGVFYVLLVNPLGAVLLGKFENMESTHLKRKQSLVSFSDQGLWLRQDYGGGGSLVIHSSSIKMPEWHMNGVMALFFDSSFVMRKRVDADSMVLEDGRWRLEHAVVNFEDSTGRNVSEEKHVMYIDTNITTEDIEDSFLSPESISFWKLPSYIKTMEKTGFDATRLKIHFQVLLVQPLLFAAMVLLAAAVSLRPVRSQGTFFLIAIGVVVGFLVFYSSSFLQALGASGQIPVVFSVWFPPMILFLLGLGVMMSLEDG